MNKTNCKNCGAPLIYGINNYENIAKCKYCNTEYHIDRLGKIEEYKVKLEILGDIHEFYLSEIEVEPIYGICYRNSNGSLIAPEFNKKMKIKLIEL